MKERLSKKSEALLEKRLGIKASRRSTFVGFRPTYFKDKSKYSKADRRKNKILWSKGGFVCYLKQSGTEVPGHYAAENGNFTNIPMITKLKI